MRVTTISLVLLFVFLRSVFSKEVNYVSVGVVVDNETWVGKMGLSCIEMAVSEFYASHGYYYNTRLAIHTRDSKSDVVGAASAGTIYFYRLLLHFFLFSSFLFFFE